MIGEENEHENRNIDGIDNKYGIENDHQKLDGQRRSHSDFDYLRWEPCH